MTEEQAYDPSDLPLSLKTHEEFLAHLHAEVMRERLAAYKAREDVRRDAEEFRADRCLTCGDRLDGAGSPRKPERPYGDGWRYCAECDVYWRSPFGDASMEWQVFAPHPWNKPSGEG